MQPGLFLQIIIMILQGICTRSDIYLCFLFDFWGKSVVEMDSPVAVIIELLLIPATYILQLQFIFVGTGANFLHGCKLFPKYFNFSLY